MYVYIYLSFLIAILSTHISLNIICHIINMTHLNTQNIAIIACCVHNTRHIILFY
jgi:hypothetical protein